MNDHHAPTTPPRQPTSRLAAWRARFPGLRAWLGSGCPLAERRGGSGVDLFSVAMVGRVPDTHAGYRNCALLDSGICDEHCIRTR